MTKRFPFSSYNSLNMGDFLLILSRTNALLILIEIWGEMGKNGDCPHLPLHEQKITPSFILKGY